MREQLHIGEVAKLIGVSTKTIRYYHEIGLLAEPQRTESGYRLYSARDLLRLQRVRRLRSLGLSLERIKGILGQPDQQHEQILRNALQSLVEELSAQILELDERREMLKKLLAADTLDQSTDAAPGLYIATVKAHLGPYLANISAESWQWAEKVDAMLGSFQWPGNFRESVQEMVHHIAEQPEQYQQLFTLEERFFALANEPENSSEVERLAEDYVCELTLLQATLSTAQIPSFGSAPFEHVLADLLADELAPAQRRFFDEVSRRAQPLLPKE